MSKGEQAIDDLYRIAEGVAAATGEAFFRSLVESLAWSLEVDYAFVVRLSDDAPQKGKTIAGYGRGQPLEDFEYQLAGTPCHDVIRQRVCCYPADVQRQFPEDRYLAEAGMESYAGIALVDAAGSVLGLIAVMHSRPMDRPEVAISALRIWAARATAELERLSADAALRRSEARFRDLFEHSPVPIFVEDLAGNVLDVNPAACRLHEIGRQELIGRNVVDLVPPERRNDALRDFQRLISGEADRVEGYSWTQTGRAVPVSIVVSRIDYDGRPALLLHVLDVTERKRAEESLRESEERFRILFEANPLSVWVYEKESMAFLAVNDAAVRNYGYSREEFLSMTLKEILPPEDIPRLVEAVAKVTVGGITQSQWRHLTKSGTIIDVQLNGRGLIFAGRSAECVIAEDITRRKQAEAALRESEARLLLLLDQMPAIMWALDTDLRITRSMGRALQGMGPKPNQTVGMTLEEYLDGRSDRQMILDQHRRALQGESVRYETQVGEMAFECRVEPLRDGDGGIVGCLGMALDVTERKHAERALRESENRFRTIFDAGPECVKLTKRDGTLLEMNLAGLAMIEADAAADVVGKCIYPIVAEEHREAFRQLNERIFEGESGTLEFEISGLKGARRRLETHSSPLRDAAGRVIAALSVTRDVTQRRRAELELLQRNHELEAIFQAYQDLYFLVSPEGKIIQYRAGLASDLYRNPAEFLGMLVEHVLPPEVAASYRQAVLELRRSGRVVTMEYAMRLAGDVQQFEARIAALPSGQFAVLVRDITQRKLIEQALRESEARFRQFAEELPYIVCMVMPDMQRILYVNRAYETIFSRSREDLYQSHGTWLEFVHPDDRVRIANRIREPFDHHPRTAEFRVTRPDGTVRWLQTLAVPLHNERGEFYLLAVIVEDITARQLAAEKQALQQAELLHVSRLSTMGQMVATMSHEIAQPLAALGNFSAACCKLLDSTPPADPELFRGYVREMARQTERAGAIVKRLRAFGSKSTPDRETCDLNWLLKDSVELVASDLRRHGVTVQWDLAAPSMLVSVDRVQFQQVMVNLLTNACEAMLDVEPPRRIVAIRSFLQRNAAVIEIVDNGTGLAPEVMQALFQPFVTTKPDGMGLGLSICREIVEDHNGQIEALNRPQRGATFRVRLPVEDESPPDVD